MADIRHEYDALEVIGKGSFGTVRKVRQKATGSIYVRKEIEYTLMNGQERNQLILELRILRELNHPNIVKYYRHDHIQESKTIHIYMEYCDGGDLAQVIANFKRNGDSVPEEFVWQVLVQTLLALHRCHYGADSPKVNLFSTKKSQEPAINLEQVVIHRDIKPDNLFMLNAGKTIKVGDFGLAKMLTSNEFAKTYVGTPYYMSPEVLMDNPYSPVCDMWSLGCVLYELCSLQPPFRAKTHLQLQARIKLGVIAELPGHYSSHLRSIIKDCITVDPRDRPSCYEVLDTLSVQFLRKEMELKAESVRVEDLENELAERERAIHSKEDSFERRESMMAKREASVAKRETLVKKEAAAKDSFDSAQTTIRLKEAALAKKEAALAALERDLKDEYASMQKKFAVQRKKIEDELMDEFDMRKNAMDQEAEEVRLNYQREFRHVVEHEVQLRLRELKKRELPPKPKGPRELPDMRRPPLKARENEYDSKRKRITDELERLALDRRRVPEFEEQYMRRFA